MVHTVLANKKFNFMDLKFAELRISAREYCTCLAFKYVERRDYIANVYHCVCYTVAILLFFSCSRSTIMCVLESDQLYSPGDHLAIYPENDTALVNSILKRLKPTPSSDQPNPNLPSPDENPGPDEPLIIEYRTEAGLLIYAV